MCGSIEGCQVPTRWRTTAWIDYGNWTEKAPFTIIGDKEVWPTADLIA